jgi:hypothetical protein
MTTDKRAQDILAKYKKARNKKQAREVIMKELDAYDRNQQWDLQNAPEWLPKPVTNFVHLVKYTKRAALAMENPTGKLRAVSPSGRDRVDKLDTAFQYVWERIKARKVVRENIETAKLLGTAFAHVHWEEYKEGRMGSTIQGDKGYLYEGEICIREIDPALVYPDPSAFTIDDCRYIAVMERKSMDWVKNHPKFKDIDLTGMENKDDAAGRGEIYNRDYTTEVDGIVNFLSFYEKVPNEHGGYSYKVSYLAGDKLLLEQPLKPNRYPFVPLYDYKQRQDFWAMSTCEFILDNQKIINKVESIIAMIGTLMQNPQKVVMANSGIDPKDVSIYGNAPGQVWVSNQPGQQAITYVEPPQIPQVLFNLLENAKANIREITGMSEAYMGQSVGSLQTSSGVNSLIDRSTMRDRDQMYDVEIYIEELSNLIIDFMVTYYDTERVIRVMGQNPNEYDFEWFKGTDYSDLEYDMFIDISAKAPITRMKQMQDAKEMANMQGQYAQAFPTAIITPQELVKAMDWPNKDEIIQRMNVDEMKNKEQELTQILQSSFEMLSQGASPQEVQQQAIQHLQEMEQGGGIGNASNSNQVQASQAGTGVGQ